MKVYAVVCNNEEEWFEASRHWIDSIHKTREGAELRMEEINERSHKHGDFYWDPIADIAEYELME